MTTKYQQALLLPSMTADPHAIVRLNDDGSKTWIPDSHPLWAQYETWLSVGNAPLPA